MLTNSLVNNNIQEMNQNKLLNSEACFRNLLRLNIQQILRPIATLSTIEEVQRIFTCKPIAYKYKYKTR